MLAQGEVEREARRVLPRLAGEGVFAGAVDGGHFGVFGPRNGWRRPLLTCTPQIMRALEQKELVRRAGSEVLARIRAANMAQPAYVLSDVGYAFVRRLAGGEEPFRAQHMIEGARVLREEPAPVRVKVNLAETPLGWLRKRKGANGAPLISEEEFQAGERLREDFTLAHLSPRLTRDWSAPPLSRKRMRGAWPGADGCDTALAAKQRVFDALEAVGPGLADILLRVCCYLTGLEEAEKELGWPRRSGKVVLHIGLMRLARHYGLRAEE